MKEFPTDTQTIMGNFDNTYRQSARYRRVANICITTPFPRLGKYPQVTDVCQEFYAWEHVLTYGL